MKKLLLSLTLLAVFTSCGKVERPEQLFDFLDHDTLENQVNNNSDDIDELQKRLNQLESSVNGLYLDIDNLEVDQDSLEQQISLINTSIVNLEAKTTVATIIDPCGDKSGYFDEQLIKLSDGSIIAYFEQNGKRFLTTLPNGNYRTTDQQACNFSIVNGQYQE